MEIHCNHHYKIYHKNIDAYWCFDCKMLISSYFFSKEEQRKYKECVAPPLWEELTPKRWKEISPWTHISYELAKKYHVYLGCLYDHEYIILPVIRDNRLVFYSARIVGDRKPKYLTAKGCKKEYWVSSFEFSSLIFICEGVADAIYMSQFGTSIALLGLHYNGSLDQLLKDKTIVICFDKDLAGECAALSLAGQLVSLCSIKFLSLEEDKDVTEFPSHEIRKVLDKTGIF